MPCKNGVTFFYVSIKRIKFPFISSPTFKINKEDSYLKIDLTDADM